MTSEAPPTRKAPIFEVVDKSPRLLDAHADFLANGGERLLMALQNTVQGGLWPWDKPAEHTAQFGAFCAGVAWVCTILRDLNLLVQNRQALGEMVQSALSSITDQEQIQKILISEYGFTESDFKGG